MSRAWHRHLRPVVDHAEAGVAQVVLTVPQGMRSHVDSEGAIRDLRRLAVTTIERALRQAELIGPEDQIGTADVLHPSGDSGPDRWSPHVHCWVPLAVRRGDEIVPIGRLVDARGPIALGRLSREWADTLRRWVARRGLSVEVPRSVQSYCRVYPLDECEPGPLGDAAAIEDPDDQRDEYRRASTPRVVWAMLRELRSFPRWGSLPRSARSVRYSGFLAAGAWRAVAATAGIPLPDAEAAADVRPDEALPLSQLPRPAQDRIWELQRARLAELEAEWRADLAARRERDEQMAHEQRSRSAQIGTALRAALGSDHSSPLQSGHYGARPGSPLSDQTVAAEVARWRVLLGRPDCVPPPHECPAAPAPRARPGRRPQGHRDGAGEGSPHVWLWCTRREYVWLEHRAAREADPKHLQSCEDCRRIEGAEQHGADGGVRSALRACVVRCAELTHLRWEHGLDHAEADADLARLMSLGHRAAAAVLGIGAGPEDLVRLRHTLDTVIAGLAARGMVLPDADGAATSAGRMREYQRDRSMPAHPIGGERIRLDRVICSFSGVPALSASEAA